MDNYQQLTTLSLLRKGHISVTTYNRCGRNGMHTLASILSHFEVYGTFQNLYWVGNKANIELCNLVARYENPVVPETEKEPDELPKTIDTDPLNIYHNLAKPKKTLFDKYFAYRLNHLSTRATHLLSKVVELADIEEQFRIILNHDFTAGKIRSMGILTAEAINLFKQDTLHLLEELTEGKELDLEDIRSLEFKYRFPFAPNPLQILSDDKLELISKKLRLWIKNLSARAKNLLSDIQNKYDQKYPLIHFLYDETETGYTIRGAGQKSYQEFELLRSKIKDFVSQISTASNMDRIFAIEQAKIVFEELTGQDPEICDADFSSRVVNKENKINIIAFVNALLSNNSIFNENEQIIFNRLYKTANDYTSSDNKTLALSLTHERTRQISTTLHKKITHTLAQVAEYCNVEIQYYYSKQLKDFIILDEPICAEINHRENVHFNILFYEIVFSFLSKGEYPVFDEKTHRISNIDTISKRYLFRKEIVANWDVYGFIKNLKSLAHNHGVKANSRIEDYILPYIKKGKIIRENVRSIAKKIISEDFNVPISEENILLPSKTNVIKKQIASYLALHNKPLHKDQIRLGVNQQDPALQLNDSQLLYYLKDRSIFTVIGRTSRYGLIKWETEKSDFKGGSIRSIAIEFLKENKAPQSTLSILEHVLKYRPKTYVNSIRSNIRLDTSGIFIFFPNGTIGLKDKEYAPELLLKRKKGKITHGKLPKEKNKVTTSKVGTFRQNHKAIQIDPWKEQFNKLAKFIKNNEGSWPSYSSNDPKEKELYTFITKNGIQVRNGLLSNEKMAALEMIGIKYRL